MKLMCSPCICIKPENLRCEIDNFNIGKKLFGFFEIFSLKMSAGSEKIAQGGASFNPRI